jgi:hypothetical protein
VAVFDAREVTTEQPRAALDIALGKPAIGAVGFDYFSDVYLWFLFGHGIFPLTRAYLTSNPQISASDISSIVPHKNISVVKRASDVLGYTISA